MNDSEPLTALGGTDLPSSKLTASTESLKFHWKYKHFRPDFSRDAIWALVRSLKSIEILLEIQSF